MTDPVSILIYLVLLISFFMILYKGANMVFRNWSKSLIFSIALMMAFLAAQMVIDPFLVLLGLGSASPPFALPGVLLLGGIALLTVFMFVGVFLFNSVRYLKFRIGGILHFRNHDFDHDVQYFIDEAPVALTEEEEPPGDVLLELDLTRESRNRRS